MRMIIRAPQDRERLDNLSDLAREWFKAQCHNPFGAYYLYHTPSDGPACGCMEIAESLPDGKGWELSDPRRISPAWTMEQAAAFLREVWRRLPVLATEETERRAQIRAYHAANDALDFDPDLDGGGW